MTRYGEAKAYFTTMSNNGVVEATNLFSEADDIRAVLGDIAAARFIINCYDELLNVQLPKIQND